MDMQTPITISALDLERLEDLLDTLPPGSAVNKRGLLNKLGEADVASPMDIPPAVVTMNSTVRFAIDSLPRQLCMTLVYPNDAGDADRISVFTPVGSALLGMSAGTSIDWISPGGAALKVSVIEVVAQPEREGNYVR